MEERIIKVSLNKAREWFKSGNSTLRELSLQAFSKEELEIPSVKYMIETLLESELWKLTSVQRIQLKSLMFRNEKEISAPKLFRIIALYFNVDWKKEVGNVGYFLTRTNFNYSTYGKPNTLGNDWSIIKHESVCYPVTYFKSEEDCKKAFKILKDLDKLDNLYTDF